RALQSWEGLVKIKNMVFFAVILNLVAVGAYAFIAPAPDSLGYFVYDFLVNTIMRGPIGFVGGVFCIALGARQLIHYNYAAAGPPFFGLSTGIPLSCFSSWVAAAFL